MLTPKFMSLKFGLKPMIRASLRARFARSVLDRRPALIVLLYHSIDPNPPQCLQTLNIVTHPLAFENHMRWIRKNFELVALSEGIRRLRTGGLDRTCVAVTFDDGLQSVAEHAIPILTQHGIPATLFINHATLIGNRCWIYDVAQLESEGKEEVLQAVFGASDDGSFTSYLRHRAPAEVVGRRTELAGIFTSHCSPSVAYIAPQELTELLEDPLFELGNHSLDHPRFSRINAAEQRRQIVENQTALASFPSYQRSFALPFGRPTDWNLDSVRASAEAGHEFISACGGINFRKTAGVDIRRVSCDGVGVGQLMDRIIQQGIGF